MAIVGGTKNDRYQSCTKRQFFLNGYQIIKLKAQNFI